MRVVVLVKHVPDTEEPRHLDRQTGVIDRSGAGLIDEINARALSWAIDARKALGAEVVAMAMGPQAADEALRRALALGADEAVHILDDELAGSDAVQTSAVLAQALRQVGFDLVVAGVASTDGQVGAVPAMLAERLGVPHLTHLSSVAVEGTSVTGKRHADDAAYDVAAELPAVISVTEEVAEPRVPGFKGIMGAKRKPRRTLTLADLDVPPTTVGMANAVWTAVAVEERPPRTGGEVIVDDGDAAQRIADFLANHQFIGK